MAAIRGIDAYGVGVAADPVGGLEHRNVMLTVEQMGRDEAGNPSSDDRDSHGGTYTQSLGGRFIVRASALHTRDELAAGDLASNSWIVSCPRAFTRR